MTISNSTPLRANEDQILLRRFVEERSSDAFTQLVRRHIGVVHAHAERLLRSSALAEDVTQAVFLLLAQKAGTLNPKVPLVGWLYTVTHFTCANARRTEVRRRRHEEEAGRMSVSTSEQAHHGDVEEHLDRILQQLPGYERDAILLRYVHDYSPAEIAGLMGTTEGAVKKRLVRAMRKVRERFAAAGVTVPASFALGPLLVGHAVPGSLVVTAVTTALAPSSAIAPGIVELARGGIHMLIAAKMKLVAVVVVIVGIVTELGGILVAQSFSKGPVVVQAGPVIATVGPAASAPVIPAVVASMPATIPGKISGVVMDALGKPVGSAYVSIVEHEKTGTVLLQAARSGTDGSFSLPAPVSQAPAQANGPQIFADVPGVGLSEGGAVAKAGSSAMLRLQATSEVHIPLLDPSGKPATGVAVFPMIIAPYSRKNALTEKDMVAAAQDEWARSCQFSKEIAERWSATSDGQGVVTLRGIPGNTDVWIRIDDDRYAGLPGGQTFTLNGEPSITVEPLQLSAPATISGTVVFADGHPAAGIGLYAGSAGPGRHSYSNSAVTDSAGHFTIKRLAQGKYAVKADVSALPDYVIAAEVVSISPSAPATVNLKAVHGGFVKGVVRDKKTGKGMSHIYVSLQGPAYPKEQGGNDSLYTDSNGGFSFREPPGEQFLTINQEPPEGYLYPEANQAHPVSVMVAEWETVSRDLELVPDPAPPVSGVVLDENNAPVAGATILCTLPNPKGVNRDGEKEVVTDGQGHFSITGFRAGMILRARAGKRATVKAMTLKFADDEVVLMVSPEAIYSLTVKPVDEEGNVVAGTTVSLASMNGNFGMGTVPVPVGADGVMHFEHLNKDVSSDVVASAPGYLDMQKTIKPGSATDLTVKLVLKKMDTPISGTVRDEKGKPVAGVEMVLMAGVIHPTVKTDVNGHYQFLVPEGSRVSVFIGETHGMGQKSATAGDADVDFVMPGK